ncbi:uncharacterized protein BO88DRAFT_414990 [Aspergillus vadensis CBS 113365]|uniref:Uncharacterized protein n=1 Tax=Aspergillus vadensis (strain CBS 113365 / IMI 142717 / IBT 24658) TaxID=1448311 RepID=A0A319B9L4_ASPVC|nr:hypothetical protein BO88DRAFT_414990 [Aspergillus vadensis CBS 113365]PYH69059.1 hypothetical protein BO88DRAFT_414990 [Aspergillus vadensis CBS 113365]
MAPILLYNNFRHPFKSLARIIHPRKGKDKGKTRAQHDLSSALTRLFANTEEDENEELPISHITEPTSQILVEDQDPALDTLLHTLSSTRTTSTSDSSTLLPLLASALDTLSTYTQNHKVNTIPIYTSLLRHLDNYIGYLIWDHEILLTDAEIIFTASTSPTSEHRHNIILQLESAYVSNYETCKTLINRLNQLVDIEMIERADWIFPRQTGWVGVRREVIRLEKSLKEIRWAGKLREVNYVNY